MEFYGLGVFKFEGLTLVALERCRASRLLGFRCGFGVVDFQGFQALGLRGISFFAFRAFGLSNFRVSCFTVSGPWCSELLRPSGLKALRFEGFIALGF